MRSFFNILVVWILVMPLSAKQRFVVAGYQASWSGKNVIQYDKLTHIHYSFLQPNADGSLKPVPNPKRLEQIVKEAHAKNVKVSIAIGGWNDGDDSAFEKLASSKDSREKFVAGVMDFVQKYKLDGVDMDWEYPDAGASSQHFLRLMKALSVKLKHEKKFLSAAVVSYGKTGQGIDKEVFQYIDMLNVMAYDGREHGAYKQAQDSIKYWTERGCPKAKIVLGLPFYGRSPYSSYKQLLQKDTQAYAKDVVGKIKYNGVAMIQKKTKLALEQCGGVMIWELSQDVEGKHSLLKAIDDTVN